MLLVTLLGCPTAFHGDDTAPDTDTDADTDADSDTDSDDIAADDAAVRALTDLPAGDNPSFEPLLVRIDYVVDGDTFYCTPDGTTDSVKVRMIGIDTPEIAHDDPAECYGNEAWAFTGGELTDRLAWLTADAEALDDYDRTLAYVIRDDTEAGFFNRLLAREGYAEPLSIAPNTSYAAEIQEDTDAAQAEGAGQWSACP